MPDTRLFVPALPEHDENSHLPACSAALQLILGIQPVLV